MAIIKLDSEFSLDIKSESVVLLYSKARKDKKVVSPKRYHLTSLEAAIKKYMQLSIVHCQTLLDVYDVIKEIRNNKIETIQQQLEIENKRNKGSSSQTR